MQKVDFVIKSIKPSNYNSYGSQKEYLDDLKKHKDTREIRILGMRITILPGVYKTNEDTKLAAKMIKIQKNQDFLEIGTGSGAIALYLSKKAKHGLATDVNPAAVRCAKYNSERLGIKNLSFIRSDIFSKITRKYDVIIFNPPYSPYRPRDLTDRMFWDLNHESKIRFFKHVKNYLKLGGRIYFGWADFKDSDTNLPIRLAESEGFRITKFVKAKKSAKGYHFCGFEMKAK